VWAGAAVGSPAPGPCSAVIDVQADAAACTGYASGNDDVAGVAAIIAAQNWNLQLSGALTRYKDNNVAVGSDTPLFDLVQDAADASAGVLTMLGDVNGPFVLTLKGGNDWAAYFYNTGLHHGQTISFNIPGVQGSGLSHASIYVGNGSVDTGNSPPAGGTVPEPSTAAALLPGLAAIGWLLRRRRRG
jgi:hypothetical protein